VDDLKGRQELYNGFGETMVRGVEFALTLAIFAGLGYGLDRLLGMVPVFTIVMFLLGALGLAVKTYYAYEAKMQLIDDSSPWARKGRRRP
jgi:F0F1-type ATP synthase assembly protein I